MNDEIKPRWKNDQPLCSVRKKHYDHARCRRFFVDDTGCPRCESTQELCTGKNKCWPGIEMQLMLLRQLRLEKVK